MKRKSAKRRQDARPGAAPQRKIPEPGRGHGGGLRPVPKARLRRILGHPGG